MCLTLRQREAALSVLTPLPEFAVLTQDQALTAYGQGGEMSQNGKQPTLYPRLSLQSQALQLNAHKKINLRAEPPNLHS